MLHCISWHYCLCVYRQFSGPGPWSNSFMLQTSRCLQLRLELIQPFPLPSFKVRSHCAQRHNSRFFCVRFCQIGGTDFAISTPYETFTMILLYKFECDVSLQIILKYPVENVSIISYIVSLYKMYFLQTLSNGCSIFPSVNFDRLFQFSPRQFKYVVVNEGTVGYLEL